MCYWCAKYYMIDVWWFVMRMEFSRIKIEAMEVQPWRKCYFLRSSRRRQTLVRRQADRQSLRDGLNCPCVSAMTGHWGGMVADGHEGHHALRAGHQSLFGRVWVVQLDLSSKLCFRRLFDVVWCCLMSILRNYILLIIIMTLWQMLMKRKNVEFMLRRFSSVELLM